MASYGGMGGVVGGRAINLTDPFEVAVNECFGDIMRKDDAACIEVWSALSNTGWRHTNGDDASYSMRAAGDLIAAVIGRGTYIDWYCSGPDETVSERFAEAMKKQGWEPDPSYYDDL